jgi:hypothetical protein
VIIETHKMMLLQTKVFLLFIAFTNGSNRLQQYQDAMRTATLFSMTAAAA